MPWSPHHQAFDLFGGCICPAYSQYRTDPNGAATCVCDDPFASLNGTLGCVCQPPLVNWQGNCVCRGPHEIYDAQNNTCIRCPAGLVNVVR